MVNSPQNKCPFICEIRLSTNNSVAPFSFPNFLLEQSQTPFGIIAELGLLFQNIDKRHQYINKNKIVYEKENDNFLMKNGVMTCGIDSRHTISQGKFEEPYICYVCFKYRFAYIFRY